MADDTQITSIDSLQEFWNCCSFLLPGGKAVIIDNDDFEYVRQFKWSAMQSGRHFYARRNLPTGSKPAVVSMHCELIGARKGEVIDHRNRNTLDNRRLNLRHATKSLNAANTEKQINSRYQYKGVFYIKGRKRWVAKIRVNGKRFCRSPALNTEEEAARTYDALAKLHFGEFAALNFV